MARAYFTICISLSVFHDAATVRAASFRGLMCPIRALHASHRSLRLRGPLLNRPSSRADYLLRPLASLLDALLGGVTDVLQGVCDASELCGGARPANAHRQRDDRGQNGLSHNRLQGDN